MLFRTQEVNIQSRKKIPKNSCEHPVNWREGEGGVRTSGETGHSFLHTNSFSPTATSLILKN